MKSLLLFAALIVMLLLLSLAETGETESTAPENFIVDWGLTASPYRCAGGGMTDDEVVPPTHTAVCDIWSDPEHIIDERVQRALDTTYGDVREIETFLYVNSPNKAKSEGH